MRILLFALLVPSVAIKLSTPACSQSKRCNKCEGACNSANDCAAGLSCFVRTLSTELVPGCEPGGSYDVPTTNYCYEPCPSGTNPTAGCTGQLSSVLANGSPSCGISDGSLDIWVNTAIASNELYDITSADMTIAGDLRVNGVITSTSTIQANARTATLAATATKLKTKYSIGGVAFDGTHSISLPGVNQYGTMGTSGIAAKATKLQHKHTIGGVAFDGSHRIDLPGVNIAGNQGTSGTARYATQAHGLRPRILHAGGAPTSSGIAPKDLPSNTVQVAFTNWAYNTWNEGYADSILLNTYYDSSGQNVNILKVRKNGIAMKVEQGGFNSWSRMASWKNVYMTSGSDERLKINVKTIEDPLTKITKLRGVNFEWREKYVTHESNKTSKMVYNDAYDEGLQMGFIAQEVEKVIPEVIERGHLGYEGLDDVLALDYSKITALLVEGVKELNDKVQAQEGMIATLSSVIEEMAVRLAALEAK